MESPIRVLLLEDSAADAEIIGAELRWAKLQCEVRIATTREEYHRELAEFRPAVILSDYCLPSYDGVSALKHARSKLGEVPFIIVSGVIGEDIAIETLKAGVTDYVLKDRLSRLAPAIRRALGESEERAEHSRAESALRESEARLRAIYERSAIGIAILDADGCILDCNPALQTLLQLSREELLSRPLQAITVPEDVPRQLPLHMQLVCGDRDSYQIEKRFVRKDGRIVWGRLTCSVMQRAGDVPFRAVHMIEDITERRTAEDALTQQRKWFRESLIGIGDAMLTSGGSREEANQGIRYALRMLGEFCAVDQSCILLLADDGKTVRIAHEWRADGLVDLPDGRDIPVARLAWWTDQMLRGAPVFSQHAGRCEIMVPPESVEEGGAHSLAAVPIMRADRTTGCLVVLSRQADRLWADEDVMLLEATAKVIANSLQRQAAEEAILREAAHTRALASTAARLNGQLELHAVLAIVCEQTARSLSMPASAVLLQDEAKDCLSPAATHGLSPNQAASIRAISAAAYAVMVPSSEPVVCVPGAHPAESDLFPLRDLRPRSAACARLVHGRQLGGALVVADLTTPRALDESELTLLKAMADLASQAIAKAKLFENARDAAERLRALSLQLLEVQESERRRIARELHDEVGQHLTALRFHLDVVGRAAPGVASSNLENARSLVNDLTGRVRSLSLRLHPSMLDDLGLLPAMLWQVERYSATGQLDIRFEHHGLKDARFSPEVEVAAYRVAQEALTNVARHAKVREANLRIRADGRSLTVWVEDHGVGFDPDDPLASYSIGLQGMRERIALLGGELHIESASGKGTMLVATFPLDETLGGEKPI